MADRYVWSGATGAADGTTWADAYTTLAAAAAVDTAGDNIYVAQDHSESTAGTTVFALAGTMASPTRILCANRAAEPPTAQANTGVIASTSTSTLAFTAACYVLDGLVFDIANSTGTPGFNGGGAANITALIRNTEIRLVGTNIGGRLDLATAAGARITYENVGVRFANAGQAMRSANGVQFFWNGGSLLSGGTSPTTLIIPSGPANLYIRGLDLSNASAGINLITAGNSVRSVWQNCRLPASWSGAFVTGTIGNYTERYEFYNCDSADTNYRIYVRDYSGTLDQETTIVRTGGASDGTTPLSWRIVTTANAKETPVPFVTPPISVWNETVGSSVTATVEIIHDSVTDLTDAEVWVEVEYLGTSGFPLSSTITDQRSDILGSAANQATSAASWATTGMTNPNEQKLSVTFTPQEKGFITARVFVGKASYTLYVDPEITVT